MKNNIMSLIKFFLGWPLSLVAVFFLGRLIWSQSSHFSLSTFHPNGIIVALSVICFLGYFFIRSIFWQQLLKVQGHSFSFKDTSFLWGMSELQRYIPGNIWSILKRAHVYEKKGIDKKTTTKLWLYEAEFLCIASLLVSLFSINFIFYGLLPRTTYTSTFVFLTTAIAILAVVFFITNQHLAKRLPLTPIKSGLSSLLPKFSIQDNSLLLLYMTASLFLFGLGTYFSIASFTPLFPYHLNTFIGFFVFAFIAGYLSFLFPMGLGPREAIMTYGLSKYIMLTLAGVGAFFSRIVLITSEILFLGIITVIYFSKGKWYSTTTMWLNKHKYILLVLSLVLIYSAYFALVTILRYNNFFTGRFDLGNMDQTVWNTVHGRIFQLTDPDGTNIISRLSVHADFILVLLAPFYLLWQDPRMLLLIQTLVVASGGIFVYLLGKDILKSEKVALFFTFLYLINPAVEYTNLYDFHGVTLATTFFLGAFYFLKKSKLVLFVLFLLLAGSTKEEAWVVVALFGLYAVVVEKKRILGSFIFIVGSGLFYLIFFKAIPLVRGGQHFAVGFYSDFGNSPGSILKTMILSPQKTLMTIFQRTQLRYLFELFFPLGFLSLLTPLFLIFTLPDFAINLLSKNDPYHEIYYQYTAVISAFLFISAIYSFNSIKKRFPLITSKALVIILLIVSFTAAYFYGPLPFSKKASVDVFWLAPTNKSVIDDFLNSIPRKYSIAASNNIGSHLSHRELIYTIPTGVDKADIVIFLLNDAFAQPSLPAQIKMTEELRKNPNYVEAVHYGDFVVFEKKSIYPHQKSKGRPNSLFPELIKGIQTGVSKSS